MAKTNGLNVRFYVEGYDLSGDANALSGMGYNNELLDVTTLDVSAKKRIVGSVDSEISVDAWFDNAASKQHAIWTSNSGKQPTTDQEIVIPFGSAVGDQFVGLVSKQGTYSVTRSPGSAISANAVFSANGSAVDFGKMLTAHDDTITSSTSGTAVDDSASSSSGGSWVYQILAFSAVGGNARWTVNLQHSSDNSTYTDVSSAHVTAIGAARTEFTGTLNRYVKHRVVMDASSGSITFAIGYTRL
tara:strand:- start:3606 stop:4337 length:732 start_codon:yes stop_codon:yes gene_type:complete